MSSVIINDFELAPAAPSGETAAPAPAAPAPAAEPPAPPQAHDIERVLHRERARARRVWAH